MYKNTVTNVTADSLSAPRGTGVKPKQGSTWYTKVAAAWGAALDRQANVTVTRALELKNNPKAGPAEAIMVSAEAQQLNFLSTAAASVNNSIGEALQTLGRRQ